MVFHPYHGYVYWGHSTFLRFCTLGSISFLILEKTIGGYIKTIFLICLFGTPTASKNSTRGLRWDSIDNSRRRGKDSIKYGNEASLESNMFRPPRLASICSKAQKTIEETFSYIKVKCIHASRQILATKKKKKYTFAKKDNVCWMSSSTKIDRFVIIRCAFLPIIAPWSLPEKNISFTYLTYMDE